MSAETQAAFYAALEAHAATAAEAVASGQQPEPADLAASSGLIEAAKAHAEASRPAEDIIAEHNAEPDPARQQELAEELQPARMARAILAGSYPGTGTTAGTGF
jgi:hypothetical protein